MSQLTHREREVAYLVGKQYSYERISDELGISVHTVVSHVNNIARKLPGDGTPLRRVIRWALERERLVENN